MPSHITIYQVMLLFIVMAQYQFIVSCYYKYSDHTTSHGRDSSYKNINMMINYQHMYSPADPMQNLATHLYGLLTTNFSPAVIEQFLIDNCEIKKSNQKYPFAKLKSDIAKVCFVTCAQLRGKVNSIVWNWVNKTQINYDRFGDMLVNGNHGDIIDICSEVPENAYLCEHILPPKQKPNTNPRSRQTKVHVLDIVLKDVHSKKDLYTLLGMPLFEVAEGDEEVGDEVAEEEVVDEVVDVAGGEVGGDETVEFTQDEDFAPDADSTQEYKSVEDEYVRLTYDSQATLPIPSMDDDSIEDDEAEKPILKDTTYSRRIPSSSLNMSDEQHISVAAASDPSSPPKSRMMNSIDKLMAYLSSSSDSS